MKTTIDPQQKKPWINAEFEIIEVTGDPLVTSCGGDICQLEDDCSED